MADVEIDLEITNPQELVGLGIRAYAIGDFFNAAAAFGRATQLMAEKNGDEHDSLGEVYIHYAKSLLEVSREEAEPLGDAIPHGDEDSSSEEDTEEGGSSNGTAEKEDTPKDEQEDKPKEEDASKKEDEPKTESKEDKKEVEETKEPVQNGEDTEEKTNGESSSQQEDPQEENCTDLQLAWEVLEVAKRIFTNRGDAGKEHLAETLILLGEVAMESENFQDGISDVKAGIEMQKELFEPTSRKLAESYYKLGIAHSTVSNIDEAVESFKNSIEILKKRIAFLKESKDDKTDEKTEKKINNINEEIEEMESLIPEIEEKISDTKSIKEEIAVKLVQEMTGSGDQKQKTPSKDEAASSSKANDISHLVKRKRKADEDSGEAEGKPAKKPTP